LVLGIALGVFGLVISKKHERIVLESSSALARVHELDVTHLSIRTTSIRSGARPLDVEATLELISNLRPNCLNLTNALTFARRQVRLCQRGVLLVKLVCKQ